MTLDKTDIAMIREMGRGYNELEFHHDVDAVRHRLTALEVRGAVVTKNHVRASATSELNP